MNNIQSAECFLEFLPIKQTFSDIILASFVYPLKNKKLAEDISTAKILFELILIKHQFIVSLILQTEKIEDLRKIR